MLLGINNGNNFANIYLAGFLFCLSLFCLSSYFFFYSKSIALVAIFISSIPSIYFLIGPLSYFYVRSIVKDNSKLSRLDCFHFLLFLIVFLGSLPFLFSNWNYKLFVAEMLINGNLFNTDIQTNSIIPKHINHLIRPFQTLFYTLLNWHILTKQRKNKTFYSNKFQYNLIFKWLFSFNCLLTIAGLTQMLGVFNMVNIESKTIFIDNSRILLLILILTYSLINICIFLFPKIMYGLPMERLRNNNTTIVLDPIVLTKYSHASNDNSIITIPPTSESQSPLFLFTNEYCDELEFHLEECVNKLWYLDTNFRLDTLNKNSGIPLHHWTIYFNEIKKQSFTEWKNSLRIDYAKKLINNDFIKTKTFESLALECGFTTQSTFIRVFKLYTGSTPRDFLKSKLA